MRGRYRVPGTVLPVQPQVPQPSRRGHQHLGTYDELLDRLAQHRFVDLSAALAANLVAYHGAAGPLPGDLVKQQKHLLKVQRELASLEATLASP
jgi:hypothetical protein